MHIENLIIEVTRRCNLTCEHCLRGNAQGRNIKPEFIDIMFSKISTIGTIVITGGEPSLVPELISYIVKSAKRFGVVILNFYMVTNGQKITKDFLFSVIELYGYCQSNENSSLDYSDDYYHDRMSDENFNMLNALKFVHAKGMAGFEDKMLNEGRAKTNYIGTKPVPIDKNYYLIFPVDGDTIEEGEVYLNAKGNIIWGCNWSYKSQEKNIVCQVSEFSIDVLKKYIRERFPIDNENE